MLSPEAQSEIANIRSRSTAGTATIEDFKKVYALLREGRLSVASASSAKSPRGKKAPVNVSNLFDELDKLS